MAKPAPVVEQTQIPKSVNVPMAALCDLFDMGNYSKRHGALREVSALDLARNVIRHYALEIEVLGEAVNCPDHELFEDEISTHCHRVAWQLQAALELVNALAESEAAQ